MPNHIDPGTVLQNGHNFLKSAYGDLGKRNAFTVHNFNGRRYYSSIDATILLNDNPVDEIIMIQWTVEEQTMPLFGYNSYLWDDVAKGNRIVSGQFAINFTVPDYLNQLINGGNEGSIHFVNSGKQITNDSHAPLYNRGFTICIGYGSEDTVNGNAPCTFLNNVIVRSTGQALDTQGQNLVETYAFIARDRNMSR